MDALVYVGHTAVSHDGAAGVLNTLVLTAVSHDDAAGFGIHWYTLDTLQLHTMVLRVLWKRWFSLHSRGAVVSTPPLNA